MVVTIGDEHDPQGLRLCGLVTASYEVHGAVGVIGVMGPARMPYDRVMALGELHRVPGAGAGLLKPRSPAESRLCPRRAPSRLAPATIEGDQPCVEK